MKILEYKSATFAEELKKACESASLPQEAKDACDAAVKALKEGSVDLKALFD